MAKIAILGFGTVGSGVYEVLCHNAASVSRRAGEPVEVKYILDPKDFTGNPVEPLVVKNIDVILQDPEIRVVVETIGGTRFAYPYVKAWRRYAHHHPHAPVPGGQRHHRGGGHRERYHQLHAHQDGAGGTGL